MSYNTFDMSESEEKDKRDSFAEIPAVTITGEPQPLTIKGYPVVIPEDDVNDNVIAIRGKDIKRWRAKLSDICCNPFPLDELILSISMLLIGFWITVLMTSPTFAGFINFLVSHITPIVGFGMLISYLFLKHQKIVSPRDICKELLADIPDPDEINASGEKNEPK